MTLQDLIDFLGRCDPTTVVPIGFGHPHSYRGNYEDLAFEIRRNVTVGEMLACARDAVGRTFEGFKGGNFTMDAPSIIPVHLVRSEGETGEEIGPVLLAYMTGRFDLLAPEDVP